jgi:hypothetical protein
MKQEGELAFNELSYEQKIRQPEPKSGIEQGS